MIPRRSPRSRRASGTKFKVSNMKTLSDGIELRILSEKSPHYNAKEETMTLEDIFLYYFGEKTGDAYDVL